MKKRIVVIAMLIATTFFWLPSDSAVSAQEKGKGKGKGNDRGINSMVWQPGKHKGWKDRHGYRNYGQYRRTQVGNRRHHMVRRYYMRDGIRLSRFVRVYY